MSPGARAAAPLLEARVGPARVWCTGRAQGNVGDHVGDDPAAVAANRVALAAAGVGAADAADWVWLRQVHGTTVHLATHSDGGHPDGGTAVAPPEADAAVTAERGLALAVVTADCAPLVVACDDAVGVIHAGHRGLAAGVIEATIATLRAVGTGEVGAFLGPCIRASHYEFGRVDLDAFVERYGAGVEARALDGRPALDIPAAIRVVLRRCGVDAFDDCGRDTAADDRYYSYRWRADAGRQATVAVLP